MFDAPDGDVIRLAKWYVNETNPGPALLIDDMCAQILRMTINEYYATPLAITRPLLQLKAKFADLNGSTDSKDRHG